MSSQKVTKHSRLNTMVHRRQVIQPGIDRDRIPRKDANKLRLSPTDDTRNGSVRYQLRSSSSDGNDLPVAENEKRSVDDDCSWSPTKRLYWSDGQLNSPEKARNLTSGSSTDDLTANGELKTLPRYRRIKANNLRLKVLKLSNEKCDIKRKAVGKQYTKIFKKSEDESNAGQKVTKFYDLRRRMAVLSEDEEQLKTSMKEKRGKCISSYGRTRRSKLEESAEPDRQQVSHRSDTSFSDEIFSVDDALGASILTKVSSRLLQSSNEKEKDTKTAAASDKCHRPAALPLADEVDDAEKTNDLAVECNEETEKHLLVCQKLMTWLNISPEVFAQSVLMNSGNVDDCVNWLLFNKTASGVAVWDPKDDKDLLNGDEEVCKSLKEKYGEMLVLKRQHFLAINLSSLLNV